MSRTAAYGAACAIFLFLAVFFFWPLLSIISGGFFHNGRFTLAYLAEALRNPVYLEGLRNSFALALATTVLVTAIGLPPALVAARCDFPLKNLLTGLLMAPLVMPPFVGALGLKRLIGVYGALNAALVRLGLIQWSEAPDWPALAGFWAVAITQALHLYPVFYLNAAAAFANIDPAMEEAAESLGCRGWPKFRRITLPLAMPGLFAGGSIVFIWSFTELGTPLMFEYMRVTAVQVYDGIKDIGANPFPYALVSVMLAASVALYAAGRLARGSRSTAMLSKGAQGAAPRKLKGRQAAAAVAMFALIILAGILPHISVALFSGSAAWYRSILPAAWTASHYSDALSHSLTLPSIRNSLAYAAAAAALTLVLASAAAYIIVRGKTALGRLLDGMVMLPLAVPGIVLAFGYLAMCQPGRLFEFLAPAENPAPLLIIAYAVRRLPYAVRSIAAGLEQTSETLEEAARSLGCSPLKTAALITLPLIAANILAAALLTFSFSMLEVSDSLMLVQKQTFFPITKALYELSQLLGNGGSIAAALGVWAMVFLIVTILLANSLLGKKLGAMFRI